MNKDTIYRQAAVTSIAEIASNISVCLNIDECNGMKRMQGLAVRTVENLPSAEPKIVYCKNCIHRPFLSEDYNSESWDAGYFIIFPDYICPLQCEDGYYNKMPKDDWFCGNGEERVSE